MRTYTDSDIEAIMNRVVKRLRMKSVRILQYMRKVAAKKNKAGNKRGLTPTGLYQRSMAYEEACNVILEEMDYYKASLSRENLNA